MMPGAGPCHTDCLFCNNFDYLLLVCSPWSLLSVIGNLSGYRRARGLGKQVWKTGLVVAGLIGKEIYI